MGQQYPHRKSVVYRVNGVAWFFDFHWIVCAGFVSSRHCAISSTRQTLCTRKVDDILRANELTKSQTPNRERASERTWFEMVKLSNTKTPRHEQSEEWTFPFRIYFMVDFNFKENSPIWQRNVYVARAVGHFISNERAKQSHATMHSFGGRFLSLDSFFTSLFCKELLILPLCLSPNPPSTVRFTHFYVC